MEENENKIKLNAENVHQLKMDPPADAWNRLEAGLNAKAIPPKNANKYYLKWAAVFILFLCAVGSVLLFRNDTPTQTSVANDNHSQVSKSASDLTDDKTQTQSGSQQIPIEKNANQESVAPQNNINAPNAKRNESIAVTTKTDAVLPLKKSSSSNEDAISKKKNATNSRVSQSDSALNKSNEKEPESVAASEPIPTEKATSIIQENASEIAEETTINAQIPNPQNSSQTARPDSSSVSQVTNQNENTSQETPSDFEQNILQDTTIEALLPTLVTDQKIANSKFSLSLFYSPNYVKNRLTANSSDGIEEINEYKKFEKPEYSYSAGILLHRQMNQKWDIATGGIFSTISYSAHLPLIYANYGNNQQINYQYNSSCGVVQIAANNHFVNVGDGLILHQSCHETVKLLNIPLMLRYSIHKTKWTFYGYAGLSANFVIQSLARIDLAEGYEVVGGKFVGLKNMNGGYLFGAGLQYNMHSRWGLFLEPSYRAAFTSLTEKVSFKCYPASFGLNTGVTYRLK